MMRHDAGCMTALATNPRSRTDARVRHGVGFWVIALAFLTQMAFCAVPTPLYAIYQERDGFATIVVTVIFSVYALGVVLSLYLAGHVSDWLGRRRVMVASLLVNVLAAVLFLVWNDVAGLVVARFVSGLGIGALTATATAHLAELNAGARRPEGRAGMVSTSANLGGIGLGPLVGGLIATWSDHPLTVPFVVFAIVMAVEAVLVALVPETVDRPEQRPTYAPQRIAVPAESRSVFWSAGASAFGSFAVLGTFMGLSPTFLVGVLGHHSHLLAGVVPFVVFASAAVAQLLTASLPARSQTILAIGLAVLGLAGLAVSAPTASLATFVAGGGIAGAGVGILFRAALGTAASGAAPGRRGETLAGVFLVAYAGMTVPVLLTAVALSVWPPVDVLVGLSVLAAALVAVAGSRLARR